MRPERKREEKEPKRRDKESPTTTTYPPTTRVREEVVLRGADILKMPHDEARDWMRYQDENGWRFGNGNPVTRYNFMRSLRMWHVKQGMIDERERLRAQRRQEQEAARREREAARKEREQERAERMAQRQEREAKRQQRLADKAERLARSPAAKRQAEIEEAEARRRAADDAYAASLKVEL